MLRTGTLVGLGLVLLAGACSRPTPQPASITVRSSGDSEVVRMNRIRVDGIIDANEWSRADSVEVLLPDGREVTILRQRGPDSIDFAILGMGGNWSRAIYPEILMDVSGTNPAYFGRDTWWFRLTPEPCVRRLDVDGVCDVQLTGFERSPTPRDRRDNQEIRISLTMLEFSPLTVPDINLSYRFSERPLIVDAVWPGTAELRRPDTWAQVDATN